MKDRIQAEVTWPMKNLLEAMHHQAQALLACLLRERAVLASQDATALAALAALKQQALDELDDLEAQRRELLRRADLPVQALDAAEFVDWAQALDLAPDSIVDTARMLRQCLQINQVNGAILDLRMRQIGQALALLRGEVQDGCYEASGRLSRSASGRSILSA